MVFHGAASELYKWRRGWNTLGHKGGEENGRIPMHWSKKGVGEHEGLGWTWPTWHFGWFVSEAPQVVGFGDSLPLNRQCGPQWAHALSFPFLCIMSQQKPLLSETCEQLSTMSSALWRLNENVHLVFLLFESGGPRRNMSDTGQQDEKGEIKFACGLYSPFVEHYNLFNCAIFLETFVASIKVP